MITDESKNLEAKALQLQEENIKLKSRVDELIGKLNLEKADNASYERNLKSAWNECDQLKKKLKKAERFILDRIYSDLDAKEPVTDDNDDV